MATHWSAYLEKGGHVMTTGADTLSGGAIEISVDLDQFKGTADFHAQLRRLTDIIITNHEPHELL